MTRRQFLRVPLLLALFLLTTSFSSGLEGPRLQATSKSELRVTRHFAAGLEYLLVEPRDVAPDAVLPMIVMIHGRGSVPEPPQRAFLDLDEPIRLVLPRGPIRHGDGYAWMPVSAHSGESPALVGPLRERVRQLSEALVEWRRRHPTRGLPIVTGFSQGGILAATLAVTHPESMSFSFPMAGWIPPSMAPSRFDPYATHVPIHALHGADDTVIGSARTRGLMIRLRRQGYPAVYEEIPDAGHEVDPRMVDRLRELVRRALRQMPESAEGSGLT